MRLKMVATSAGRFREDKTAVEGPQLLADLPDEFEHRDTLIGVCNQLRALADQLEATGMKDIRLLRAQLHVEETAEFILGMLMRDDLATFDALLDTTYVLGGSIEVLGFADAYEDGFAEVHVANMRKPDGKQVRVRDKGADWVPPNLEAVFKRHGFTPRISDELKGV